MKIGIDLFPLKTYSFTRGIGKYSYNLVKHLIKNDEVNIFYLFNVPAANNQEFSKKNTIVSVQKPSVEDANRMDIFIITSLIELDHNLYLNPTEITCKKILLFYDLIPIIFWENYIDALPKSMIKDYFYRLSFLSSFDKILAISNSTKKDLINLLNIPENRISVIYGGLDENYKKESSNSRLIIDVLKKYGITNKFILNTPGIDFRKNISGLFNAFANLNPDLRNKLDLVLVCRVLPNEEQYLRKAWQELNLPLKNLILTNYVQVEELIALYDAAEIFVFPSYYEGLGLPVLEAMSRGCPVITSNVSSLPEICESAALYIDPANQQEIARFIEKILNDEKLKKKLIGFGLEQYKKFSWNRVAFKVNEVCNSLLCNQQDQAHQRYKIAFFTPLNPMKSGISDYSEELLPYLVKMMDIDVFINDTYSPNNDKISRILPIYPHTQFEKMHNKYDMVIYQLGNSEFHTYMIDYIQKYPGIVVQHDLTLHGLIFTACKKKGIIDKEKYLNYHFTNHGYLKYLEISKKFLSHDTYEFFDLNQNFAKMFIDKSFLTLVHNHFTQEFLSKRVSFADIWKINHGDPMVTSSLEEKQKIKTEMKLGDRIIISSFGRITKIKRPHIVLKAFSNLINNKKLSNIRLNLVGELQNDCEYYIKKIIKEEKLENFVTITGFTEKNEFNKYYKITDICVNLRYPSSGETSGTIIKSLAYGIPTITSNYAQYVEYPNHCCWKVDLEDCEVELLTEYLHELISNQKLRDQMSKNALRYAEDVMPLEKTAKQYMRAIEYAMKLKNIESSEKGFP